MYDNNGIKDGKEDLDSSVVTEVIIKCYSVIWKQNDCKIHCKCIL